MKRQLSVLSPQFSVFSFLRLRRTVSGQALVEYAIVFPLQLLVTLIIVQIAHLFVAQQVVEYSAFCAARAGLSQTQTTSIDQDACKRAAVIPLSAIAGTSGATAGQALITVPGWDPLPRSGAADMKTTVSVTPQSLNGQPTIYAEVRHDYELNVPIANAVIYKLGDLAPSVEDVDRTTYGGAPHLKMTGTSTLAQPWGE